MYRPIRASHAHSKPHSWFKFIFFFSKFWIKILKTEFYIKIMDLNSNCSPQHFFAI